MPSRHCVCFNPSSPAFSRSQIDSQLSALDVLELDASMAPQRFGRAGSVPSLFDFCKTGPLLFVQTCGCPDISILLAGRVCMSQILSACDVAHMDPLILVKNLLHLESSFFLCSRVRIGLLLLVLDNARFASSMFLHRWV